VRPLEASGLEVRTPPWMAEIVATLSHLARQSPQVNQRSGVSVRLTVANLETLVANAARRSLLHGEDVVVPRVSDLDALAASTAGKVEIEAIEEDRGEQIVEHLLRAATLEVFRDRVDLEVARDVVAAFDGGRVVQAGEDVSSSELVALTEEVPELASAVSGLTGGDERPAVVASAVEFVLDGLHLSKRLNKDSTGARSQYRGR